MDLEDHPDLRSFDLLASFHFGPTDELADDRDRYVALAMIWGGHVAADYLARSQGMTSTDAEALFEEIHAAELAKPRPGLRGILGGVYRPFGLEPSP